MKARRIVLLAAALAVATGATNAATDVTVRVTDRQGNALRDAAVGVRLIESETARPPWSFGPEVFHLRSTGADGQVTFPRLEPGIYTATITGGVDEYLISPTSSGSEAAQGRFTVRDEPRLTVPIVVGRGDQVTVEFKSDVQDEPCYEFAFVEAATGARVGQRLCNKSKTKVLVPVGRWRVEFEPPRGLVFRALELDGVTAPRASATLEIVDGGRQRFVTFTFTGPCMIRAHVASTGGDGHPPDLFATQLATGPLTDAAIAVGAPPLSPAEIPQFPTTYYHGSLPDGVWRIAPVSELLESSDPPFVDVDCTSTSQHAVEFTTRMRDGDATLADKLTVVVLDPNGKDLDDAVVEIYRQGAIDSGGQPLASRRTRAGFPHEPRQAVFTGLPRESLVVVAGHEEWIDATADVPAIDENQRGPARRSAFVHLRAGATIDVDAQKPDGSPAQGVSLELMRQDPTDSRRARAVPTRTTPRVNDAKLRRLKENLEVRTDATGRARMRGIEPGRYEARGEYSRNDGERYIVQVREGAHEPTDSVALAFEAEERIRLSIVLRTAASMTAVLLCDDGGALPLKLDARLLPADPEAAWRRTLPVGELADAIVKLDGQPVGGPELNRLRLGPLAPGTYALAIRPQGFDRWSFAGGGDDPSRSMTLQLGNGQEVDLGTWTIPCRPSLLLVPRPIGELKTRADVSHAAVTTRLSASATRVDRAAAERRSYNAPEILPLLNAMRLYGVPNEPVNAALVVRERFLLPEAVSPEPDPLTLDLERGQEQVVPLQFEALAGSIDIAVEAPAARALSADGTITSIPHAAVSGLLRAGPLRPGAYSVEICADPACSRVTRRFDNVTVTALAVTALPPPLP